MNHRSCCKLIKTSIAEQQMNKIKAVLLGIGNIGLNYDLEFDAQILTHAKALYTHPRFELVAAVDPNPQQGKLFSEKYQLPAYRSFNEQDFEGVDLFVIAAPVSEHFHLFKRCISYRPKCIVCEKPLVENESDLNAMFQLANSHHCYLITNYIRRFLPGVMQLKNALQAHRFGKMKNIIGLYSRGYNAIGCHLVDLICHLISDLSTHFHIDDFNIAAHQESAHDYLIDCEFKINDLPIVLRTISVDYHHISCTIFTDLGKVEIIADGSDIQIYTIKPHPLFSQAKKLEISESIPLSLDRYQYPIYDYVESLLENEFDEKVNHAEQRRSELISRIKMSALECEYVK